MWCTAIQCNVMQYNAPITHWRIFTFLWAIVGVWWEYLKWDETWKNARFFKFSSLDTVHNTFIMLPLHFYGVQTAWVMFVQVIEPHMASDRQGWSGIYTVPVMYEPCTSHSSPAQTPSLSIWPRLKLRLKCSNCVHALSLTIKACWIWN